MRKISVPFGARGGKVFTKPALDGAKIATVAAFLEYQRWKQAGAMCAMTCAENSTGSTAVRLRIFTA
jgi:hypothetical protein